MPRTKWSDIRDEHVERIGREEFEAGKEQMLAEAGGRRLAEIRRRRGFTRAQVATRMGLPDAGHPACRIVVFSDGMVGGLMVL
jgi:hypothetical protein